MNSISTVIHTSLGQISNRSLSVSSPPAAINWPSYLPNVVAMKNGEHYSCNLRPEDLIDFDSFTDIQYVDYDRPDSSGDGTSWATAEKYIGSAVDNAIASGNPTRIFIKGGVYPRNGAVGGNTSSVKTLTANITLEAVQGPVTIVAADKKVWSQNVTYSNVYQMNRSQVNSCVALNQPDEMGIPKTLTGVASIADVAALGNSFYTDGTTVYAHLQGGIEVSDSNCFALMNVRSCEIYADNNDIYARGITWLGGDSGIKLRDGTTNKIVFENCNVHHQLDGVYGATSEIDGFVVLDCGLFAAFNCNASNNSKDGFNFHISSGVLPTGLLVNCKANYCGQVISTTESSNGFTAHDGVHAIAIGCEWLDSSGTNSGHVSDGTVVWEFGSVAGDSSGDIINGGAITWGAFGAWSGSATLYLEHCRDVGAELGLYSATADGASIHLRQHSGTGLRVGTIGDF